MSAELQNRLFQKPPSNKELLHQLNQIVEKSVILPLKTSPDPDTWFQRLEALRPDWEQLRLSCATLLLQELDRQELTNLAQIAKSIPMTLLDEPAAGAADYARQVLVWLNKVAAEHNWQDVQLWSLEELLREITVLELCWLTLLRIEPPHVEVAREAAWEAYSHARSLRRLVPYLGLEIDSFPRENPVQAGLRAQEMIRRLAAAWVEEDVLL